MCLHARQHEAGLVHCVFHEAVDGVLELFGGVLGAQVLVPRARGQHEGAIGAPGKSPDEGRIFGVIQEKSVSLFLVWNFNNLRILLIFDLSVFPAFDRKLVEKLLLIFEFAILVNSNRGI